jgi:hypothetical protein
MYRNMVPYDIYYLMWCQDRLNLNHASKDYTNKCKKFNIKRPDKYKWTYVWLMTLKHFQTYKKKSWNWNNNINTTKWGIPGDKYSLQSKRCMIIKFLQNKPRYYNISNKAASLTDTHPAVPRDIRGWVPCLSRWIKEYCRLKRY